MITKETKSFNNLEEADIRILLTEMGYDKIDQLISIAKESPLGIGTDISIPVILLYFHDSEIFNVTIGGAL